jgi:ATP synthase H subunit
MEKTEILEKIKEAEKRVDEAVLSAEEESKKIIVDAKLEARKIIEEAEKEGEKVKAEIIEKAKGLIEQEKAKIREEWNKEISNTEASGKKGLDRAADFLYNEFVRMIA